MEFKIDTKDIYTLIIPVYGQIDANLTEAVSKKRAELGQSVSQNLIIDLSSCTSGDAAAYHQLIKLHTDCYSQNHSIVFTHVNDSILEDFKKNNIDTALNITPTLIEAIDIISMEMLERDLLSEE